MADDFQALARNLIGPLWPWIKERMGALTAADIPNLPASIITSGILAVARGGSGVSARPVFFVHKNGTAQTGIVTATHTKVTWPTETLDTGAAFASDRYTPQTAGTYLIILSLYWDTIADQAFMIPEIYRNGSLSIGTPARASITGDQGAATVAPVSMNGTSDYLEAFAYQSSGVNKNIGGNATATYFCGAWIAP
jgi:hypothetical protein